MNDEEIPIDDWFEDSDKFALQVTGSSMINEHIADGDYVIIQKATAFHHGQIIAIRDMDGEAILRRAFQEKDRVRLETSETPEKPPVYREKIDMIGVLVGVVRKY